MAPSHDGRRETPAVKALRSGIDSFCELAEQWRAPDPFVYELSQYVDLTAWIAAGNILHTSAVDGYCE